MLALTGLGAFMVALDALVVAAALTTIRRDLHASVEALEWTVNAYTLSFAVFMMPAAVIGERWGRRRTYAAGLVLFTVASIGCASASSVPVLVATRAVQGAGAAVVMPLAMALLGVAFGPERRGWAIGVFSGLTGLAVLGGPVIGGVVTQGLAWQWIFWINVPVGAVAVPLVLRRVSESRGGARRLDPGGMALLTGAVFGVVWGVVRGAAVGWSSPEVPAALVGGGLLLAAFVAWERRAAQPMVPMGLFRSRSFTAANAAGLLLTAALYGAVFFNAQFMQVVFGSGPLVAGLRLLPWTATLFLVAPLAGRVVDRIGERPLVVAGLTLQAVGMFWIGLVGSTTSYAGLVVPLMVAGCGVSMAMPAAQSASVGAAPPEMVGIASGLYAMTRQLGGVIGVAVLGAVFVGAGGYASFPTAFARALVAGGVLSLLGAVAGLGVASRRGPREPAPAVRTAQEVG
ncbi:DHA2 family efflux MFS transporter permease subunit [Virgisporangium ochraceum]|uniref:MFS transporter n=1 Tax=Virgisporangium ochraceum TaxID=65505 RepID=A0A8J4A3N0_9ACTN|nr:MFS transporter [Virgisporangium ochraceum]